jgi:alpha-glucosidase
MKKVLSLLLAFLVSMTLFACTPPVKSTIESSVSTEPSKDAPKGPKNTITGNVKYITGLNMPQFHTHRTIRIYLPKDYDTAKDKKYPVLYMQDGQNLFDDATSYSGEWGIDETIERFFEEGKTKGVIVVGIDNGGQDRTKELTPWKNEQMGGGQGAKYAQFIVETLKPYIDKNYRTLSDREHTGIAGSSFGGLISFYTGLKYQEVFGMIGAFSTSFWFNLEELNKFIETIEKTDGIRLYMDAGNKESASENHMVTEAEAVYKILKAKGFTDEELKLVIDPEGVHHEDSWKVRFPEAFLWLMR